jgi:hypothetical protein
MREIYFQILISDLLTNVASLAMCNIILNIGSTKRQNTVVTALFNCDYYYCIHTVGGLRVAVHQLLSSDS